MGVFYFLFDRPDDPVEFGLDVVAPKTQDGPASGGEVLVDFVVTLDVAVDFVFPEQGIVDRSFSSVPILAMKELRVDKEGNLIFFEDQIGCAKNGLAVFSVTMASMPQGFGKTNFGLGVFAFDTGHYLASLFGGKGIHVFAFGVAVWIKLWLYFVGWG